MPLLVRVCVIGLLLALSGIVWLSVTDRLWERFAFFCINAGVSIAWTAFVILVLKEIL